ncbi:MAG: IMPACT family protein [Oscillospiraceae bacterium]|jgi:uncharacterized YigZ family protein
MDRIYKTPAGRGSGYYEDRKSRFYGEASSVSSRLEAEEFEKSVREKYREASHYVTAYSLRDGTEYATDNGEPSGTAGRPVLDCIVRRGLTDAAVVVVRYFGGTLLGTGGLVRAYSSAASAALDDAGEETMEEASRLLVVTDYRFLREIKLAASSCAAMVGGADYTDRVALQITVRTGCAGGFISRVRDITAGSAEIKELGTEFAASSEFDKK